MLSIPEDDNLSLPRAGEIDSDITTENSGLHETDTPEPESEWWSGFDDDDPAVTDAEPTPDSRPRIAR